MGKDGNDGGCAVVNGDLEPPPASVPVSDGSESARIAGLGDVPEAWQHALDDLWGCIGKREMDHLQPETVRLAKENHEALWHNHAGPVCMADGLPWFHPHHFATVKSPNE